LWPCKFSASERAAIRDSRIRYLLDSAGRRHPVWLEQTTLVHANLNRNINPFISSVRTAMRRRSAGVQPDRPRARLRERAQLLDRFAPKIA
jgi:hypothetical protein